MGRVKEQLLNENWINEKQNNIIEEKVAIDTILYADLFDFDEVNKAKEIEFKLKGEDFSRTIAVKDIVEINGVCIKYKVKINSLLDDKPQKLRVVPFSNILYIDYIYDWENVKNILL